MRSDPTENLRDRVHQVTHAAELDASGAYGGGYLSLDWEVFGDEYFAKKEWIKEDEEHVEAGTFKLHHTPGA